MGLKRISTLRQVVIDDSEASVSCLCVMEPTVNALDCN